MHPLPKTILLITLLSLDPHQLPLSNSPPKSQIYDPVIIQVSMLFLDNIHQLRIFIRNHHHTINNSDISDVSLDSFSLA